MIGMGVGVDDGNRAESCLLDRLCRLPCRVLVYAAVDESSLSFPDDHADVHAAGHVMRRSNDLLECHAVPSRVTG